MGSENINSESTALPSTEEIIDLVRDDKITLAKLKTLIEIHPGIVQSSIKYFDALVETTKSAQNSQNEAFKSIRENTAGLNAALKVLAEKSESDATREKIAEAIIEMAKIYSKNYETIRKMNSSNNKTWKHIGKAAIAGLGLVAFSVYAVARRLR